MSIKMNIFDLSEVISYVMQRYEMTRDEAMDYIDLILFAKYESLRTKNITWVHDPDGNFLGTDSILIEFIKDDPLTHSNRDFDDVIEIALDVEHIVNGSVLFRFWDMVDRTDSSLDKFERSWSRSGDVILEIV
ncbi:MAG: hypothetical protein CL582_10355 [Alteromonadaceae bacterium]|nr:hypothetical protein [Alteromonadaceae bacterium]|tara:strand:+ start:10453 stop:10851 length:399 start_codon:yes stop_codon:yes gene_type:complete